MRVKCRKRGAFVEAAGSLSSLTLVVQHQRKGFLVFAVAVQWVFLPRSLTTRGEAGGAGDVGPMKGRLCIPRRNELSKIKLLSIGV